LGFPSRLCNRHFKNPNASARRIGEIGKVSLIKDEEFLPQEQEMQQSFVILKPIMKSTFNVMKE
jgi:hypothetical protein